MYFSVKEVLALNKATLLVYPSIVCVVVVLTLGKWLQELVESVEY